MHPVVGANIETDVSLTVAQISIVSVLLTYAGFGIHNIQNVHQKTMSSPTSCFYCNCFIGLATAWIWEKKHPPPPHATQFLCVCTEFNMAAQMPERCRVNFGIECSVSPSWLLDCGRMDGELGMNKWMEFNMLYLHSVKLFNWKMVGLIVLRNKMTNGKLYIHNAQCSQILITLFGTFAELKYWFFFKGVELPSSQK